MAVYKEDITNVIHTVQEELDNELNKLYCREDFESKIGELSLGYSNFHSLYSKLQDMFKHVGIECEEGKSPEQLKAMLNDHRILQNEEEIKERLISILFEKFQSYASPEDYMRRIVQRNCNLEDGWEDDSVRLRILKQFIKYGDYLSQAKVSKKNIGGKNQIIKYIKEKTNEQKPSVDFVVEHLDDKVFDYLTKKDNSGTKRLTGKYGLLKLSDDLAKGLFRKGTGIKEGLYLFAIVFGMNFYLKNSNEIRLDEKDIEKNLFKDYYANYHFRVLSPEYREKKGGFDPNISEEGINFKNSREAIFIYFIRKNFQDLSKLSNEEDRVQKIGESIKEIYSTIDKVEDKKKDLVGSQHSLSENKDLQAWMYNSGEVGLTKHFRDEIDNFLKISQENLINYLLTNYQLDKARVDRQESANQVYADLQKKIQISGQSSFVPIVLEFSDEEVSKVLKGKNDSQISAFIHVINEVNRLIRSQVEQKDETNINKVTKEKETVSFKYCGRSEKTSRTEILLAFIYYYYYVQSMEEDGELDWIGDSFKVFFENFMDEANTYLEKANYHLMNKKNFLDFYLALSLFFMNRLV